MTDTTASQPGRHRVADVQLRGPAPRGRARVHWPNVTDATPAPALVVLLTPSTADSGRVLDRLVERIGAVVLAVAAAHIIEAHATLAWAADHAAELGAEPGRLAIVGDGPGAAVAERVAELAFDEGWPPLRHVALIWPHDDPDAALDRLAEALAEGRPS